MSYKWPDKDRDEVLDYSIDWSRFLGDDSISGVVWYIEGVDGSNIEVSSTDVVNGLQFIAGTNTNTVSTIRLGLGTNNIKYKITCRIDTLNGLVYERSVNIRIKEK